MKSLHVFFYDLNTLLCRGLGFRGSGVRGERKGRERNKEGRGTSASDCTQYGGQ